MATTEGEQGALQDLLDAVASPVRREILWLVWDRELAAGDIATAVELSPATVSSHLASLRRAGLVAMRAEGTFRRYRADREAMAALVPLLASADTKWQAADDLPERHLADATVAPWATVATDLPRTPRREAFRCFTDGERYTAFLGAPVQIRDGRFRAEMEWGTTVRGIYEVVAEPDLVALRWDFDDDAVPVPGRHLVGYLRFTDRARGSRVEVHQQAADPEQAEFLAAAWSMVLGRLRAHLDDPTTGGPRARRPKRRS